MIQTDERGPNWPLPDNYHKLDPDERRLARLRIVCDRTSPEADVLSWDFFRRYYLNHEDSGWYDNYSNPAPDHYDWVKQVATHDRVVLAAHRGSAKSTIFKELIIRDLLTVPRIKHMLVMMTVDKAKEFVRQMRRQLVHNDRITGDFGNLKPAKGDDEGAWTMKDIELLNGSILQIGSVTSTSLRGSRPHCITLDDPEYDPYENTDIDRVVSDMHTLVFNVLIPMLRRKSRFRWIGTPIHVRLFLWRVITGEAFGGLLDTSHWFRKIYPGLANPYDDSSAFWPEEYPAHHVARIRREWKNFGAEFLCKPGSDEEKPLIVVPEINGYSIDGDDPILDQHPLDSQTILTFEDCTLEKNGETKRTPRREVASSVFKNLTRFVTIDGIRVPGPHSDYAVMNTMGVDKFGQIFQLDMWSGKVRYAKLCEILMNEIVPKWLPRVIGVEAYSLEMELLSQIKDAVLAFGGENGWRPYVKKIEYEQAVEKPERIGALESRFRRGLIKLPLWRKHPVGLKPEAALGYRQLFDQIDAFTPSLAGLDNDDAIDTLAMSQQIVTGHRVAIDTKAPTPTIMERLRKGQKTIGGVPIALAFNINDIPGEVLEKYVTVDATTEDPDKNVEWLESTV